MEEIEFYEIIGFITTILCVWLNAKEIIWGFPVAIVACAFYSIVFFQSKLYSDAGLQLVYIVLNGYGWYEWLHGGKNKKELRVISLPTSSWPLLFVVGITATTLLGYLSHTYTDASIPYLDAATTVISLLAQWMLAKKYLENWLVWIGVDVVYAGMFGYKDRYMTAALYFILVLLAIQGYRYWKKAALKLV